MKEDVIKKAMNYAYEKHKPQKRKIGDMPYFVHLLDTASTTSKFTDKKEIVAASFLHDILEEKTGVTLQDLKQEFGEKIANIVFMLTETKSDDWKEKKESIIEKIKKADQDTKIVRCADAISNITSFIEEEILYGKSIWASTFSGKDKQIWYYKQLLENMEDISSLRIYQKFKREFDKFCNTKVN